MIRRLASLAAAGITAGVGAILPAQEAGPVRTDLESEEVWTGQGLSLVVTLISPGPFSGTARFQLPEIPKTLIVKRGNPVVGSDTVDGESMITQRHEFAVYTQQIGTVEIPAFRVDFESKDTFLGEPVPRSGSTAAVSFSSKRPPGTEDFGPVVTSATLQVEGNWSPVGQTDFEAGDILSWSITREATDLSAMLLPPIQPDPIEGVRIYRAEPEVIDRSERGVITARRTDTIRYRFERGGTFAIPEWVETWWNPKTEKPEWVVLEGLTVSVAAAPVPPKPIDRKKVVGIVLLIVALIVLTNRFLVPVLRRRHAIWRERRYSPEAVAGRALVRACRRGDAREAYAALADWRRASGPGQDREGGGLREPAEELSRRLYGGRSPEGAWDGAPLLAAFRKTRSIRKARGKARRKTESLPPLNPRPVR